VRVLVVEGKVKLASVLRRGLRKEGLSADIAPTGEDAIWMAGATPYDAVILDVMLPGFDGFETCRRLRSQSVWSPILMLTARESVDDRVAGLDSGADDYLTKPFSLRELLARLRALMRRGATGRSAERAPCRREGQLARRRQAGGHARPLGLAAAPAPAAAAEIVQELFRFAVPVCAACERRPHSSSCSRRC
jgi:DNA-binding response OmpR family regulator